MTKKLAWEESWGKVDWKTVGMLEIQRLIDNGADICMIGKDSKGRDATPILMACRITEGLNGRSVEYQNANIRARDILRVIHDTAKKQGISEIYMDYLDRKCLYNEEKELKKTRWDDLTWEFVSEKVIKEMVKKGLDVNQVWQRFSYSNDESPLLHACEYSNMEAVKTLVELGADPNLKLNNRDKRKIDPETGKGYGVPLPLFAIDEVRDMEIANYLIEHGAKVTPTQKYWVKRRDKNRKGILSILDSLNKQKPTEIRKAAKEAAVKVYRSKNPKTSGR